MKTSLNALIVATCVVLSPIPTFADDAHHKGAKTVGAVAATEMADGEIRRIDLEGNKLTLKHGEIKNLDMPGMTMVFQVKDKAMLEKLKTGDKVKFRAINDAGKYTVTEIQPAP